MGEGGPGASEPGDHPSACGQVGGPLGPGLLPAPRPPSPGSQGPEKSSVSSAVRPGPRWTQKREKCTSGAEGGDWEARGPPTWASQASGEVLPS